MAGLKQLKNHIQLCIPALAFCMYVILYNAYQHPLLSDQIVTSYKVRTEFVTVLLEYYTRILKSPLCYTFPQYFWLYVRGTVLNKTWHHILLYIVVQNVKYVKSLLHQLNYKINRYVTTLLKVCKDHLLYEVTSISSGSSVMFTSNLSWTEFNTFASFSSLTNVIAKPLVPNLPARATYSEYNELSSVKTLLLTRCK